MSKKCATRYSKKTFLTKDNELYILTLYDMILNSVEIFAIVYRTIDRMIFIQIVTGVFSGRGGLG